MYVIALKEDEESHGTFGHFSKYVTDLCFVACVWDSTYNERHLDCFPFQVLFMSIVKLFSFNCVCFFFRISHM